MDISWWLDRTGFSRYIPNFVDNGYDMRSASRMSAQDLIAIGIKDCVDRRHLKQELSKVRIGPVDCRLDQPLEELLSEFGLFEYLCKLTSQNIQSINDLAMITVDDLDDIGIHVLGHQKRFMLMVKSLERMLENYRQAEYSRLMCMSSRSLTTSSSGFADIDDRLSVDGSSSMSSQSTDMSKRSSVSNPQTSKGFNPTTSDNYREFNDDCPLHHRLTSSTISNCSSFCAVPQKYQRLSTFMPLLSTQCRNSGSSTKAQNDWSRTDSHHHSSNSLMHHRLTSHTPYRMEFHNTSPVQVRPTSSLCQESLTHTESLSSTQWQSARLANEEKCTPNETDFYGDICGSSSSTFDSITSDDCPTLNPGHTEMSDAVDELCENEQLTSSRTLSDMGQILDTLTSDLSNLINRSALDNSSSEDKFTSC